MNENDWSMRLKEQVVEAVGNLDVKKSATSVSIFCQHPVDALKAYHAWIDLQPPKGGVRVWLRGRVRYLGQPSDPACVVVARFNGTRREHQLS